jgi:hypothetical protein
VVGEHDDLDIADPAHGDVALAFLDGLDRVARRQHARRLRDRAEVARDQRERFRLVETAGDDEHSVVRLVVSFVERLEPLDRHVLDVAPATDRRLAVRVPGVGRAQGPLE